MNTTTEQTHDYVNHPKHYNSYPVEAIEVIELMRYPCLANAVKYAWRAGMKNDIKEDIQKMEWYINRHMDNVNEDNAFSHKQTFLLIMDLMERVKGYMSERLWNLITSIIYLDHDESYNESGIAFPYTRQYVLDLVKEFKEELNIV